MGNESKRQATVLATHTPQLLIQAVARAARMLKAGEVVALPTETVYGLAANALDPNAVARIYAAKGRPAHNPIIVHVADLAMARQCASVWPKSADKLAAAFWPGPLTMVLPRSSIIPDIVTAGGPTVGIRWPNHPIIQAVIHGCGFPLAAPSANPSNRISPTTAQHVQDGLGSKIPLILDGGPARVGLESTVIDLTSQPARLLRPGMIHAESLAAVLGKLETPSGAEAGALRSPGMLKKHYAPRAKLMVFSWADTHQLEARVAGLACAPNRTHILACSPSAQDASLGKICLMPHEPGAFARSLYAELHRCDEEGAELIIVQAPPSLPEWQAIADRLLRAAG